MIRPYIYYSFYRNFFLVNKDKFSRNTQKIFINNINTSTLTFIQKVYYIFIFIFIFTLSFILLFTNQPFK